MRDMLIARPLRAIVMCGLGPRGQGPIERFVQIAVARHNKHAAVFGEVSHATFNPLRCLRRSDNVRVVVWRPFLLLANLHLFNCSVIIEEHNFQRTLIGLDPSCPICLAKEAVEFRRTDSLHLPA